MLRTDSVLGFVTLFLNSNVINDLNQYQATYSTPSHYYLYNTTGLNQEPELVDYDIRFTKYTYFPKCCPPGFQYESDNRDCVEKKSANSVYEELNIKVNYVKYGLHGCPVVVDRTIQKDQLKRSDGNGRLSIEDETFENGKFCIDNIFENADKYVIRLCREKAYCLNDPGNGTRNLCIHKCCPDTYALQDGDCVQTPKMGLRVKNNSHFFDFVDDRYGFLYDTALPCGVANWMDFRELNFTIKRNGSLFRSDETKEYKVNEYCLDTRYNSQTQAHHDVLIVCEFNKALYAQWAFLRVCVILSCVCFAITITVYLFIYKMRKPWEKIIVCFCAVDLVFYILYALRIFYVPFKGFCTSFGYIYYFITLSRLTWLNVLSYDIWYTTGRAQAKAEKTAQMLRKKFIHYSIYAIAVPLMCTVLFILAHQRIYVPSETLKPYINPAGCALSTTKIGNYAHYLYLFPPIWVLVIVNLVFYIRTVVNFLKIQRDLKTYEPSEEQKRQKMKTSRKGFIILKLGLIMGITWIYHIYEYAVSFGHNSFLQTVGGILRFSNILEGVYFLLIFVIKWKIIKRCLYNLGILKEDPNLSISLSTNSAVCDAVFNELSTGIPMSSIPK